MIRAVGRATRSTARRTVAGVDRAAALVLVTLIRVYRAVVSPWVRQQCKYHPSCSAYGLDAVRTYGAFRGGKLAVARVLRCNPWSHGGVDYVPGTPDRLAYDSRVARDRRPAPTQPART